MNQTTTGNQKWPAVATDAEGDFVVTWTSYGQDGAGNGYGAGYSGQNGVYARRYNNQGTATSNEFLVNTYTANNQQHSSVAMDSAGDFTIAWESYQERQQNVAGTNSSVPINYGIYAQQYARASEVATNSSPGGKRPDRRRNPRQHRDGRRSTVSERRHGRHGRRRSSTGSARRSSCPMSRACFMQSFDQTKRHGRPGCRQGPQRDAGHDDAGRDRHVDGVGYGRMTVASNIGFPTGNQLFNVEVDGASER